MSVTLRPIPLAIQTLYADLLQQLAAREVRPGSPYRRRIKGTEYIYLKRQAGNVRLDHFLGRSDAPETAAALEKIAAANRQARDMRKLVSLLRRSGLPAPASTLGAVLDVLDEAGLLSHCVLVGTASYHCYAALTGYYLPVAALTTQDADIATASLAIAATKAGESLADILKRADPSFAPVAGLDPRKPPSRFKAANGFMVDLLTPQLRRSDTNPMPLPHLEAGAVPMQYLGWLIEAPTIAAMLFGAGIAVHVPQPQRFALHKLIIAQKRTHDRLKRAKDLLQAQALIEALLLSDRWALAEAFEEACGKGRSGWRQPILRSLAELRIDAKRLAP